MAFNSGIGDLLDAYELTVPFTWQGVEYRGAISDRTDSRDLGEGGYALGAAQVLVVATSQFASTRPAEKDKVTVNSKTLRIDSVTTSPDDGFLVCQLTDPNRGV